MHHSASVSTCSRWKSSSRGSGRPSRGLSLSVLVCPLPIVCVQASSALDAAISEALANPSTPLPLGLKPPSVDGVLEELNRQGITMLPPLKGCGAHGQALDIKAELLGDDMLSEVDNHPLSLCGDMHGESDDALNALLDP